MPQPVTTPSAGKSLSSMPNCVQRCRAKPYCSWKLSGSSSASITLAGRELAGRVLLFDSRGASAQRQVSAAFVEFSERLFHQRITCRVTDG